MAVGPASDPASSYTPFGADSSTSSNGVETVIVTRGESFWSLAEETLQDAWGVQELTDEEIVSYWKPLIAANEDRLIDPGNPDLILPDQELVLPPTPQRP